MNKALRLFFTFFIFAPLLSFCQTATISGSVADENNAPVAGAVVTVTGQNLAATTDNSGLFSISNVPYGTYTLMVAAEHFTVTNKEITVNQPSVSIDPTVLRNEAAVQDPENVPSVSLAEEELKESSTQSVASSLNASRDAFTSAATFGFSIARFRIRGYENENFITLMNGAPLTDLTTGNSMFYTYSGLNDVVRSRETSLGLEANSFSFGGIGGAYFIDSRASRQRKQLQVSYSLSNRSYDNRVMATYGTGILKSGWSFALSGSRRWAKEGYVAGTSYDGWSIFGSAEKQIGLNHSISLTAFTAPGKSGRASAAVQEMYDLAGSHYYNPSWGWQNGEKRNSKINSNDLKTFIFTHEWKINDLSTLTTAASFVTGKSKSSGLDWYNATNPYPDYYRNLPSFIEDDTAQAQAIAYLQSNDSLLQINWNALYEANSKSDTTVENASGIPGNAISGKWAQYILQNYVTDQQIINLNTIYNNSLSDHIRFSGGLNLTSQKTEYYREVKDLLGADFYVDINKYAEQDNPNNFNIIQNDLNNPNRILGEGDKFGYDYIANIKRLAGWWQADFTYDHFDFFLGTQLSRMEFYRDGKFRNGLFPDNSYGKSETHGFTNYAFKAGATYKINGRNYVFANAAVLTSAPLFENVYVSPRTRDFIASNIEDEKITSVEGGYLLKAPRLKGRVVGYLTNFTDGVVSRTFFNESTNSFGTLTMTGVDKRHTGVEIAVDATLGKGFSASAVAAVGQYFYTARPTATFTEDESAIVTSDITIYSKNLRVAGSPQASYTAGVSYRSPKFWFVNVNVNYFDKIYTDFSPIRRTLAGVYLTDSDSALWNEILGQEKLESQVTLDLFCGYSYKLNNKFKSLKGNTFLVINVGINNILNNQDFISNGYEQLRFDFEEKNVNKYAPKYYYAPGRTYFINLALRFN